MKKILVLFVVMSAVVPPLIIAGSVVGAAFSNTFLFVGALIGGALGVLAASRLAVSFDLIPHAAYRRTALGGEIGFVVASLIAVRNLHTPIIPALCGVLVPIGAVVGSRLNTRR